ncbi:hypothetical protein FJT64_003163 [Amphibalanus amphitrite]|uniref:Uncharacterized protein n=1 Tax=Amphibalanus amphitrite TaxID=1232801 RepID=A0A6A4W4W1_AMPAM|nr:hypothetical protein FJT64_003163 [Amphibalanus amphitrite]
MLGYVPHRLLMLSLLLFVSTAGVLVAADTEPVPISTPALVPARSDLQTGTASSGRRQPVDPVHELLRRLQRRRRLPALGPASANFSLVLVTGGGAGRAEAGRPLRWPRSRPPLPVSATLVGVPRLPVQASVRRPADRAAGDRHRPAGPLSSHNMDEAPVTRYNVQNLVPANGFLASSPITDAVGGHGALYQANTVGAQHASAGRRILLSEPVLGPLDGWSSKVKDAGTGLPSTHTGHQMPPWFTAGRHGTWTEIYNGSISRGDKPVTQEQQTRTEDVPGRRRGQTRLPSLPKSNTRPASAMAPSQPPVADQHVTRKPLSSADQVLSDEPAVTGLLSQNVSAAIWTDLVGGGDSVSAPPGDPPLEPLVSRLTQLGSQFVQGEPAPPQAGLAEQLLWLRDRLGQLNGPDALDVVVGVGANLVASHLDNAGTRRRAGGDRHEPVCRCPESSVTPGVLAALTSLLALLIYAGSLATVAATSGTTTATSTSTATARSRSSPASLPGLRPMSTLLLRWLDGTVSPDRCHSAGLCRPHRLGTGRRLEQLGVPINRRQQRRPALLPAASPSPSTMPTPPPFANTNSPTLTNTDNDVITTAANANPVNTNTNTLTNNDNDVITNTNTATNNGRSASAPRTAAVVRTLLSLVSARSWRHEPCFQRQPV